MTRYIGLIDGEPTAYGIVFPDLPGCTSMGNTVDEVIVNGSDALHLWIECVAEDGGAIPEPRDLDSLRRDPDVIAALQDGAIIASVPVIRSAGEETQTNLLIDTGILAAIDDEAKKRNISRSDFITIMAREMIPKMA